MTRAGCDAICPSYGSKCEASRGIVSEEALAAAVNLREQHDVPVAEVLADLQVVRAGMQLRCLECSQMVLLDGWQFECPR